jgi:hypothetical protein
VLSMRDLEAHRRRSLQPSHDTFRTPFFHPTFPFPHTNSPPRKLTQTPGMSDRKSLMSRKLKTGALRQNRCKARQYGAIECRR